MKILKKKSTQLSLVCSNFNPNSKFQTNNIYIICKDHWFYLGTNVFVYYNLQSIKKIICKEI